jgi:hypothetical protein
VPVAQWLDALDTPEETVVRFYQVTFIFTFFLDIMSDSPDVSLMFNDVRKMNNSQINKLTKQQLTLALKNAISSSDSICDDRITASTLKSMMTDAVFQLRQELLSEQQRLLSTFQQKIDAELKSITDKLTALRYELQESQAEVLKNLDAEFEERLSRRSNLVFFGVEEADETADGESRRDHDRNMLNILLRHMNISDDSSSFKIRRIGRPSPNKTRLLHIECKDINTRNKVLKNRTLLKTFKKKVFVQPDMTRLQQQVAKDLRVELKHRREMGENVVVRNNKIVPTRQQL